MEKLIKYEKIFIFFSVIPFTYLAYVRFPHIFNSFPVLASFVNNTLIVLFTLIRFKPVDVTLSWRDWIMTIFANASAFLPLLLGSDGIQIISTTQSGFISLLSLFLMLLARFQMGRNIGFVPAKRRKIVQGSVYRIVRHPIYTSVTLNLLSWLLIRFSLTNFCITLVIIFLFCLLAYHEEKYLMKFPEYVSYTEKVKYRFIPFVI